MGAGHMSENTPQSLMVIAVLTIYVKVNLRDK